MLNQESVEKLTALLKLPATGAEQDWDVELADAARLSDFLAAYEDLPLEPSDRSALMALLLASTDRFIGEEGQLPREWERISALLRGEKDLHRETISYWSREDENDPDGWFALTPYMRELAVHTST